MYNYDGEGERITETFNGRTDVVFEDVPPRYGPMIAELLSTGEQMREMLGENRKTIAVLQAQLEDAQVRISGLLVTWHTADVKPSALEPVQGWYEGDVCGYRFHRIVQWDGLGWIAMYDHKPCSPPDRWAYLPKFVTEVTP